MRLFFFQYDMDPPAPKQKGSTRFEPDVNRSTRFQNQVPRTLPSSDGNAKISAKRHGGTLREMLTHEQYYTNTHAMTWVLLKKRYTSLAPAPNERTQHLVLGMPERVHAYKAEFIRIHITRQECGEVGCQNDRPQGPVPRRGAFKQYLSTRSLMIHLVLKQVTRIWPAQTDRLSGQCAQRQRVYNTTTSNAL